MRREAERTLHSLSRAYQEELGDVDYEVIVVENGSDDDQKLGAAFVASFGPEFRYLDLGADAHAVAGRSRSTGASAPGAAAAFALMIDGAHVLTPGVLRFGLAGLATYAPAIVATQQWYVGPGQQGDAMDNGYDQAYEDRLFDAIDWPSAGYRLFEIGHFVGDRDWLDGVWESNCMFVAASLLEQVGGFDESFSMAGGGYANLELYERLGSSPDVTVATIIGEGSFHQIHGGTTTNQTDAAERRSRVFGYSQHYADLRGRAFKGPGKPIHYVGRIAYRRGAPLEAATHVDRTRSPTSAAGARRRPADDADARCPTSSSGRSPKRCGAACRGRGRRGSGDAVATRAHRPARVPGADRPRSGPTGSSRPAPATAAARCSSRRSASSSATARCCRSTTTLADDLPSHPRLRYQRRRRRTSRRRSTRCGDLVGEGAERSSCSARCASRPRTTAAVRGLRAARARRLVRGRHRHDRQRAPGLARLRPGSGRGGQADPRRATASSSPTR